MTEPEAPRPVARRARLERVLYEKAPPRATITLNRPEVLNAFDFRMLRELARACEDASWDDDIRVVVLTGAGRAFCVGADLTLVGARTTSASRTSTGSGSARSRTHTTACAKMGKPTVARINGICVGGGNELQMACDLAVMVDDAYIRHVGPEHGSVPAGGATQWLPIMVGERRAREIVLLCEEIPATKAEEWGLVNRCVPAAELDAEVDRLVENLARKLPQTTRYASSTSTSGASSPGTQTINHARDWLALSMATEEPQRRDCASSWRRNEFEQLVLVERDEPIAVVLLNRPEQLNALSGELMDELVGSARRSSTNDEEIRCIVLGRGRARVRGGRRRRRAARRRRDRALLRAPRSSAGTRSVGCGRRSSPRSPAICLGGGCELAMACDLIVASETAQFGQPETGPRRHARRRRHAAARRAPSGKAVAMDVILSGPLPRRPRGAERAGWSRASSPERPGSRRRSASRARSRRRARSRSGSRRRP